MSTIYTAAEIEAWSDSILMQIQETADLTGIRIIENPQACKAIEFVRAAMANFDNETGAAYRKRAENYTMDFEVHAMLAASATAFAISAAMMK